jgi:RNA polymerase sigma factor (sigma-70 family)
MRQGLTSVVESGRTDSIARKLKPTAKMPNAAVLQRFSQEERELLERRLTEPIEYMYHPSFRRRVMPASNQATVPTPERCVSDTFGAAVGQTASSEVLSPEEERTLFLRFNYCRCRVVRVLARHRGRRLTAGAARELLHWSRLAQEFRTQIVRANTSLVLAMARRSRNRGVELAELVSEGNLALLRCVDKFDVSRGYKFSTYACRAILASFSRAGAKAARQRAQFPTPFDPAMERSDYLETRREVIEHECVEELKRILFENSAALSQVERRVLNARFLLDQPDGRAGRRRTLDQVGDLLGVSKERVRQIQNQAMIKLRAVLEERLLAAS